VPLGTAPACHASPVRQGAAPPAGVPPLAETPGSAGHAVVSTGRSLDSCTRRYPETATTIGPSAQPRTCDPQAAAGALAEALALWRGPALSDLADDLHLQGALARLEEQRLDALELRFEVDLTLGRHAELAGELESLVATHPLQEQLWGQLIVALYRCQRQAEALDAYRQARQTLAEDARARLRPYQERVLAEIQRFGGTPQRSHGQTVVGVFGVPSAHEDDPERAVRAGLRILEAAEERHADPGNADADAQAQLRRALPFFRQVGATAHLQEGMVGRP
jgi:tetratricopeptide (TPR) repeat protein